MLEGGFAGVGVEGAGEGSVDGVGMGLRVAVEGFGGAVSSRSEGVRLGAAALLFLAFGTGLRECSEAETSEEDGWC